MLPEQTDAGIAKAQQIAGDLQANIAKVIRCNNNSTRWLLAAFFSGGHVLLEDVPGTGKTTLAKSLAASIDCDFKRIQFTPDLLPSDILGVSVFDQNSQDFRFREGPIFTQILLADEINRASPRTQSALLEAMGENQVSVDGKLLPMDENFFVIATQNPVEFHGTYPLPEAQMDRFAMRFDLGYVSLQDELAILNSQIKQHPLASLTATTNVAELISIREVVSDIRINDSIKQYIVELVSATRTHPGIQMGASPRASITLMKCAQALALLDGLAFVTPDIVQELAVPVIAHRLSLDSESQYSGADASNYVTEVMQKVNVPD